MKLLKLLAALLGFAAFFAVVRAVGWDDELSEGWADMLGYLRAALGMGVSE